MFKDTSKDSFFGTDQQFPSSNRAHSSSVNVRKDKIKLENVDIHLKFF